ncbi:type I polyketide synthase, partial [Kitasatospora phosalacinea]|uniref:type I polyketide synthase n=1 Tax=Kitasatospora phosalacinea TaxID=2065 RepID=UPI0005253453
MTASSAAPVAIVGHACLLPGAADPAALWDLVLAGRSAIGPVRERRWRLAGAEDPASVQSAPGPRVAGHVDHAVPGGGSDPLTDWARYVVEQALHEAGLDGPHPAGGLVLGTLAYPTETAQRLLERRWATGGTDRDDRDDLRFATRPAAVTARRCGLGLGGFALDSACASGLVAVKLAADRLRDGSADLMVAAAVNRADNLLVHNAFHALSALSPTGASRPMDRSADGLVPAEGAAAVALMRLPDALRRGVPVLAVVRGIGLSNDGRSGGPLAPSETGQLRAMRAAYAQAGVAPETVSLLECHATGTPVGDLVEARSAARLFADAADLPLGSVKSNLGHPLAVGGLAGLVKVVGALRAGTRPPTLGVERPLAVLDGTPLRPLTAAEEWHGLRRAAVSAFGFGGSNAHLVVDAWTGDPATGPAAPAPVPAPHPERGARRAAEPEPIVVVGRGACRGDAAELELTGLGTAPRDLERAATGQLRVLAAARAALRGLDLPADRTLVVVAGRDDTEVARYGLRWRRPGALGPDVPEDVRDLAREASAPPFDLAAVLGTMPNMSAHRVNGAADLRGPGLVVYADGESGRVAVDLARRALRDGEADAAVVADAEGAAVVLRRASDAGADGSHPAPVPDGAGPAELVGPLTGTPVEVYTGGDRAAVRAALAAGRARPPADAAGTAAARLVLVGADRAAAAAWLAGEGRRPAGAAYRDEPLTGETGFVFTNGSAAYPGMGAELLAAVPAAGPAPAPADDVLGRIHGVTALASAHVRITRDLLGLRPAAALGYSSGEVSALAALGVWADPGALVARSRAAALFRDGLTGPHRVLGAAWGGAGRWKACLVPADADDVRGALEPRAHLMARNAPGVSVIGGDPQAVERTVARLGVTGVPLDYDIAAHVPELESVRGELEDVHTLPTVPVPGVRFYRCTDGGSTLSPDSAAAARAVAGQAVGSLDWIRTVRNAWDDGVRIFVEHGPQGLCTGWTARILAGRPHLAVALDSPVDPLGQFRTAVAELLAAGLPLRTEQLFGRAAAGPLARFALADEPPRLPDLLPRPARMAPAPPLPRLTRPEVPHPEPAHPEPAHPEPAHPERAAQAGPGDGRWGGRVAAAAAHRARVATAHGEFLRTQAEAHRRFLAGRAAVVPAVLGARRAPFPPAPFPP